MKRAKDRWTSGHLAVGILFLSCLVLPQTLGAKATSLFRTTTTPTTTTADPTVEEGADPEEVKTNGTDTDTNSTYVWLPQKDYVRDPNLPRELNGYNLSSYPFLSTVPPPDQIHFKCEENLHDGFYASVEFKCQVYHQCLYGFRYDFLCANYTAFDQKTFICHFVSEVDCVGSSKYWNRNDALYKATTAAPVPTTPTTTTTTTPAPPRPRPGGRRRPSRRRRPQYDYYDDEYYPSARDEEEYYEDEARRPQSEGRGDSRRRKRPRPAQRRPAYDDDYEDDRYERRQEGRTRIEDLDYEDRRSSDRPRKGNRRPADDRDRSENRKPAEDRDRDRSESRKPVEDRDRPDNRRPFGEEEDEEASTRGKEKRKPSRPPFLSADKRTSTTTESDRRNNDEDRRSSDDDRRGYDRPRRPFRDEKPLRDVSEEKDVRRDERPLRDRPFREDTRDRPYRAEDRPRNEGRNNRDQDRIDESREEPKKDIVEPTAGGALVKPVGASIYNRPRVAPKIARPVPISEKNKFKYVTAAPTTLAPLEDEYYDDYEIEDPKSTSPSIKSSLYSRARPEKVEREVLKPSSDKSKSNFDQDASIPLSGASGNTRQRRPDVRRPSKEDYEEEIEEVIPKRPLNSRGRDEWRYSLRKRPVKVEEEYYYDDVDTNVKSDESRQVEGKHAILTRGKQEPEGDVSDAKLEAPNQKNFVNKNRESAITTTTSTEAPTTVKNAKNQGFVRVVKRPFLPSRGGSPYLPRGLQPLGGKNGSKTTTTAAPLTTTSTTQQPYQLDYSYESDYDVKDDKPSEEGRKNKKPVEKYSAEYSQSGEQSYEADDKPKVTDKYSSGERNFDKQISYTQSKQKADEVNQNRNSEALSDSSKYEHNRGAVSSVEEDILPPNEESDYRDSIQYDTPSQQQEYNQVTSQPEKLKEKEPVFKASPQFSPEPYKPTNRPYTPKIPENISIKQNLADIAESDYDVTLNDALNPTLPNLTPIRNFPSPFIASPERDYTYSRFRNGYQEAGSQQYNQYRNQDPSNNNVKYSSPQRFQGAYKNPVDSSISPSESHGISVRTPQSFYIQQPKYSSSFSAGDTNSGLRPSHVTYRQASAGDYYV